MQAVKAAFYLDNREIKRELKVQNNDRLIPFCPNPTYLGVKLDRLLTFCHHLMSLRKKLSSCVTLLTQLVGLRWGAGAIITGTAALSLVYSTTEYCAPTLCLIAHPRLIDSVMNNALRIVTKCLRTTPTNNLITNSFEHPTAELRRLGTILLVYRGSLESVAHKSSCKLRRSQPPSQQCYFM